MDTASPYYGQVRLLTRILPLVAVENSAGEMQVEHQQPDDHDRRILRYFAGAGAFRGSSAGVT